jgi:YYY domain-containing protein
MSAWLRWYVAVEALGLLALPLAASALRRLPDRGWFFAKTLGVLVFGLVLWLGVATGVLRNDVGGAWIAAAGLAGISALVGRDALRPAPGRVSLSAWLRAHVSALLLGELLFALAFAGWALVRAQDPAANHTERPMDLMLITAIHVSPEYPPPDPWLSGYPIGYYYLGHWMLNAVGLLAGQPPGVAFNLGQACWLALLVCGCFGLGFDMLALDRPAARRTALACGLVAATAVPLAGNPQGTLDALQRAGLRLTGLAQGRAAYNLSPPGAPWWWWRASRVLEDRDASGGHIEIIDEFPAFSYLVGDAHSHLLAMPFVALALALALNVYQGGRAGGAGGAGAVAAVLVLGALPATNAWDFPTQWLILFLAGVLALRGEGALRGRELLRIVAWAAVLAGAVLVSAPYLLTAQSQVQGLALDSRHPTPPFQLVLMLGPLLLGVLVLLAIAARGLPTPWRRLAAGAGAGTVLGALVVAAGRSPREGLLRGETPATALFLAATLGMTITLLAARAREPRAAVGEAAPSRSLPFALLLAAVGLFALLVPEVLYVKDGFGTRMNTVFKLYYQAWLLLGLATTYCIGAAWSATPALRRAGRATLGLVLSGLVYTGAAVWSVTGGFGSSAPSLDALAYLAEASPDEHAALLWVRSHTTAHALVLQARGQSYMPEDGRLSAGSGRATLLGWEGHEVQWRGQAFGTMARGRAEALETVYRLAGAELLARRLEIWGIDYVFVGPAERRAYGVDAAREELFGRVMEQVFAQGNVRIYRRRDG